MKEQNIDRDSYILDPSSSTIPLGTNSEDKMELITRKLLIYLYLLNAFKPELKCLSLAFQSLRPLGLHMLFLENTVFTMFLLFKSSMLFYVLLKACFAFPNLCSKKVTMIIIT